MTWKNVRVVIGFGIITASQLALGIFLTVLAAKSKGKGQLWTRKNYVSFRAPTRFIAIARVQPVLSHRYPSTHSVCVNSRGTDS